MEIDTNVLIHNLDGKKLVAKLEPACELNVKENYIDSTIFNHVIVNYFIVDNVNVVINDFLEMRKIKESIKEEK